MKKTFCLFCFFTFFGCAGVQSAPTQHTPPAHASAAAPASESPLPTPSAMPDPYDAIVCTKEKGRNVCRMSIIGSLREELGDRSALACEHNMDTLTLSCRVSYSKPLAEQFITHATYQCVGELFIPLGTEEMKTFFGGPPCTCAAGTLSVAGPRVWTCVLTPHAQKKEF